MQLNRKTKIVLVGLGAIVGVPAVGICMLVTAMLLQMNGSWPFKPFYKVENEIHLANGGTIRIEAVEDRGWQSEGWFVSAHYAPLGELPLEKIGDWFGYNHEPSVYLVDDVVVLLNPDEKRLHVRTREGKWKFFIMRFPDEHPSLSMSHYTTLTTLTEDEIRSIRKDIEPDERDWSPAVHIRDFDPQTREVHVLYQTNLSTLRHIRLRLSDDGCDLMLLGVRKEKTDE